MSTDATISKTFEFSASHQLVGLEDTHPCSRLHGHNYVVEVSLTGTTNHVGFVMDYRDLGFVKHYVDEYLDHQHLNNMVPGNPTAENLAAHLLDLIMGQLRDEWPEEAARIWRVTVGVSETPKTWARVSTSSPVERPLTPEELDADRYRWNFAHDGRGRA